MTRYYALTQENISALRTVEAFLYAPFLANRLYPRTYRPAGQRIATDPQTLPPLTYTHLPTHTVTLDISDSAFFAKEEQPLSEKPHLLKNLQKLTQDFPPLALDPKQHVSDLIFHLSRQVGEIAAARLLATSGLDGWYDAKGLVLCNPNVVTAGKINDRLLGKRADPLIAPKEPPQASLYPRTEAALHESFKYVESFKVTCGFAYLYESTSVPDLFVVAKNEGDPLTTLEGFVSYRLAAALGAPVPLVWCCLDSDNEPFVLSEHIKGPSLTSLRQARFSAYEAYDLEQRIEMANMAWTLLDHMDPNDGNFIRPFPETTPILIDAGGTLRSLSWGGLKNCSAPGQYDWESTTPWDALFIGRKARSLLTVDMQARAHAFDRMWQRRAQLRPALRQAAQEIAVLSQNLAPSVRAHFSLMTLEKKVLHPIQRRLAKGRQLIRRQITTPLSH